MIQPLSKQEVVFGSAIRTWSDVIGKVVE